MSITIFRSARGLLRPDLGARATTAFRFPHPCDPKLWTALLSPDGVAEHLAALGDSAIAYWAARSVDDLRLEMRGAKGSGAGVRYQIARSILAAQGIEVQL